MKKFQLFLPVFIIAVLCSFMMQPKPWDVPAEFKTKQNPVKKTDKVLAEGKLHYTQVCAGCHGASGLGDGEKVKNLVNIKPASLLINLNKLTDGEHFYIIKYGRGRNHSFAGKLDDEAIWATVHYMKTFANK